MLNHILKQYIQWRPQQLPELLTKMKEPMTAQHIEADRALIGRGDYILWLALSKQHSFTIDRWKSMSIAQQSKASDSFFRLTSVPAVISIDGTIMVPMTSGAGKKRARNARTITFTFQRMQCKEMAPVTRWLYNRLYFGAIVISVMFKSMTAWTFNVFILLVEYFFKWYFDVIINSVTYMFRRYFHFRYFLCHCQCIVLNSFLYQFSCIS